MVDSLGGRRGRLDGGARRPKQQEEISARMREAHEAASLATLEPEHVLVPAGRPLPVLDPKDQMRDTGECGHVADSIPTRAPVPLGRLNGLSGRTGRAASVRSTVASSSRGLNEAPAFKLA